jgi:hypothetical protein
MPDTGAQLTHERDAMRTAIEKTNRTVPSLADAAGHTITRRRHHIEVAGSSLAAGRSPQPIFSASSTMIPSGPRT